MQVGSQATETNHPRKSLLKWALADLSYNRSWPGGQNGNPCSGENVPQGRRWMSMPRDPLRTLARRITAEVVSRPSAKKPLRGSGSPVAGAPVDPRIAQVMVELSRNDDANVSVVAARAGLSISSLRRLFATQTGLPIGRYLRKLRMGKACLLLETSAHSIKEIAALIGYADASHFSRAFKKSIGATPMQYIDVRII